MLPLILWRNKKLRMKKASGKMKVTKLSMSTDRCCGRSHTFWVWWLLSPCCSSSSLASASRKWPSRRWFFTKRVEVQSQAYKPMQTVFRWSIMMHFVSEEKFNLSANYCSHIEEHTNDPVYAEIEKEVAFLEINRYLTQYFRLSLWNVLREGELRDKAVRDLRLRE